MKQITRVTIKAKKIASECSKHLCVAVVAPDAEGWVSVGHIQAATGLIIDRVTHGTLDSGIEYLHNLAEKYPNQCDVPIIIVDV